MSVDGEEEEGGCVGGIFVVVVWCGALLLLLLWFSVEVESGAKRGWIARRQIEVGGVSWCLRG